MTEAEWIAFLQRPEIPAFNRAMLENPDDDLPRLVFADWMDENCPDAEVNAAVRESIMPPVRQAEWPDQSASRGWRLGFVRGRVRLRVRSQLRPTMQRRPRTVMEAVWRAGWVDELLFHTLRYDILFGWFTDRFMGGVTSIGLPAFELWPDQLKSLVSSPLLKRLTHFGLNFERLSADFARVVAGAPITPQLRSLTVTSFHTDPPQMGPIVGTPRVTNLEELVIIAYRFDDAAAIAVSNTPYLTGLKHLHIDGITVDGAAALANSQYLCESIRAQYRRPHDGSA